MSNTYGFEGGVKAVSRYETGTISYSSEGLKHLYKQPSYEGPQDPTKRLQRQNDEALTAFGEIGVMPDATEIRANKFDLNSDEIDTGLWDEIEIKAQHEPKAPVNREPSLSEQIGSMEQLAQVQLVRAHSQFIAGIRNQTVNS